jgi:predicted HTH domain antitoxin
MSLIQFEVPDETLPALQISRELIAGELRMLAAVKLYETGRLSSGAAANLAGIPRVLFLRRLADYGADTFRLTEAQLRAEESFDSGPCAGSRNCLFPSYQNDGHIESIA